MNRFIRNEQYRVPFKFCQECKEFRPFGRGCLSDDYCRKAVRLYRNHGKKEFGIWEDTDNRWGLGRWRCSMCGGFNSQNSAFCPNCGMNMDGERKGGEHE